MGDNTSMITDDFRLKSERLFEKYCDKNSNIKYVYKDGDCGQQHFSIVYRMNLEKQRLFYRDYIIQLQYNSIWIIETKGGEKMAEVKILMFKFENKFEEFKEFAKKHSYNFGIVRDRNDEMYLNKTEYIDDMRSKN